MRQKEVRCVVTFRTTAAAMEMERLCKESGLPGRLIPIPRTISAGCGLCWSASSEAEGALEDLVMAQHLMIDGIYAVLL